MDSTVAPAQKRKFSHVSIHVRPDGERFPLVIRPDGVPAHYATCLLLDLRAKNKASGTLEAAARDLLHLEQILAFERIDDFDARLEAGHYLKFFEVEAVAQLCGVTTTALRRLNGPNVIPARRRRAFSKADMPTNQVKHRRISTIARYIDLVGRIGEASTSSSAERRKRRAVRDETIGTLKELRPKMRSSRVRKKVRAQEVWARESIRIRNWAIVTVLVFGGLRQGEARQLKAEDLDTNFGSLDVLRRPDDPEDPRDREPNGKTADRRIPVLGFVAERLDDYVQGAGSDAALLAGSPFAFLTHGPSSSGRPISSEVVSDAVRQLGAHLGLPNLHPHALRSAWIQHLADWATEKRIEPAELDRFANYLGGWSYFSQSASHYRGDHLTQKAYEAGLRVEESR